LTEAVEDFQSWKCPLSHTAMKKLLFLWNDVFSHFEQPFLTLLWVLPYLIFFAPSAMYVCTHNRS
jgi:hypothetical protein